jgi:serine/threonine protein kinase
LLKKTRGQGFSLTRIQKITRGILRCLESLSRNRIIHCDIKPENILLRRTFSGVSAAQGSFTDTSIKASFYVIGQNADNISKWSLWVHTYIHTCVCSRKYLKNLLHVF